MKVTRVYSDKNGDSRFEDVDIELFDNGNWATLKILMLNRYNFERFRPLRL